MTELVDWPTRAQAERLRQWPLIVHAAEKVAEIPGLDGLLLLGSFAAGRADEISDVDLLAVVTEGRFNEAWKRRREIETPGTLVQWDVHVESDGDAASHKWITREIVKVECGFADASRSAMQLAEPYAILVGDTSVASRFPALEPIPTDVLEAYAKELRDKGMVPEVETQYGELRRALRQAMSGESAWLGAVMAADPHAAAYDRIATRFEQLNAEMPESLVTLGDRVLRLLPPRPRILDVGCGPGRDMAWFEARKALVTGIDVSAEMLVRAGTKTRGSLAQMDMRKLNFAAASFDAVWAIASLLHIPKAEAPTVVSEFRRVVNTGGVVAVAVKRGTGERWVESNGGQRFFAYYEPAELEALLTLADLNVERIDTAPGLDCEWLLALAQPAPL